jgi:hypothetical protein
MKPLAQLGEVGLVGGEGLERLLRVVIGWGAQDVTATGNPLHGFHQIAQSGDGKPDVFRLPLPPHLYPTQLLQVVQDGFGGR